MKLLKAVLTFITVQLLIGYIGWEINPANWDGISRLGGVLFGVVLAAAVYAISTTDEKNQ